jgi:uncharacterized membrane protein AbrB (regulator of aidB expression)
MVAVPLAVLATMILSLVAGRLLARHRLLSLNTGMVGIAVAGPPVEQLSEQVLSGVSAVAVAVAGIWAGRRVRLPAAALAGPLVLGMVLAAAGAVPEAAPPSWRPQLALGLVAPRSGCGSSRRCCGSWGRSFRPFSP